MKDRPDRNGMPTAIDNSQFVSLQYEQQNNILNFHFNRKLSILILKLNVISI